MKPSKTALLCILLCALNFIAFSQIDPNFTGSCLGSNNLGFTPLARLEPVCATSLKCISNENSPRLNDAAYSRTGYYKFSADVGIGDCYRLTVVAGQRYRIYSGPNHMGHDSTFQSQQDWCKFLQFGGNYGTGPLQCDTTHNPLYTFNPGLIIRDRYTTLRVASKGDSPGMGDHFSLDYVATKNTEIEIFVADQVGSNCFLNSQQEVMVSLNIELINPSNFISVISTSDTMCAGTSEVLYTNFSSGKFEWYKDGVLVPNASASSLKILPDSSCNYTVKRLADSCSIEMISTPFKMVVIPSLNPSISAFPGTKVCQGGSTTLVANPHEPKFSYQWYTQPATSINGATSASYTATKSGDYFVLISQWHCSSQAPSINFTVIPPPNPIPASQLNLNYTAPNFTLCAPTGYSNYLWRYTIGGQDYSSQTSSNCFSDYLELCSETIEVSVQDANGCNSTFSKMVIDKPFSNNTVYLDTIGNKLQLCFDKFYGYKSVSWRVANVLLTDTSNCILLDKSPNTRLVKITVQAQGCSETLEYVILGESGIDDLLKEKVTIYPNPLKDDLFIQSGVSLQLRIYNAEGQEVKKTTIVSGVNSISLKAIPAGIYMLRLTDEKGVFGVKVLKE